MCVVTSIIFGGQQWLSFIQGDEIEIVIAKDFAFLYGCPCPVACLRWQPARDRFDGDNRGVGIELTNCLQKVFIAANEIFPLRLMFSVAKIISTQRYKDAINREVLRIPKMIIGRFFVTVECPRVAVCGMDSLTRPAFIPIVNDAFPGFSQYAVFCIKHSGQLWAVGHIVVFNIIVRGSGRAVIFGSGCNGIADKFQTPHFGGIRWEECFVMCKGKTKKFADAHITFCGTHQQNLMIAGREIFSQHCVFSLWTESPEGAAVNTDPPPITGIN